MDNKLYTIINKQHLHNILETFYECEGLSLQVLNEDGEILDSFGTVYNYCRLFRKYVTTPDDTCTKVHSNASKLAVSIGESYIFSCHSNLNHIVFPLTNKNVLLGSILVGPFLMQQPDSILLSDLVDKYKISTCDLLELYEDAGDIPIISPSKVTYISRLLYYICLGLVIDKQNPLTLQHHKLYQQSEINEFIQTYKSTDISGKSYPYEKEKALITKLKTGNVDEAKALLNELLGYVFFSEGSNLDIVKTRAIELCSLLSRAAIEGGATSDSILKANNQFLMSLQGIQSLENLCYKLQESIDIFTECMFNITASKNSELIKNAIRFISKNFTTNITLNSVADHVHLNPAYFSSLFKQSTGSSFKEYLNMIRIEESKRLLANSDISIIDISLSVGFADQSYFSKIFKKYTGLTPKQYR